MEEEIYRVSFELRSDTMDEMKLLETIFYDRQDIFKLMYLTSWARTIAGYAEFNTGITLDQLELAFNEVIMGTHFGIPVGSLEDNIEDLYVDDASSVMLGHPRGSLFTVEPRSDFKIVWKTGPQSANACMEQDAFFDCLKEHPRGVNMLYDYHDIQEFHGLKVNCRAAVLCNFRGQLSCITLLKMINDWHLSVTNGEDVMVWHPSTIYVVSRFHPDYVFRRDPCYMMFKRRLDKIGEIHLYDYDGQMVVDVSDDDAMSSDMDFEPIQNL